MSLKNEKAEKLFEAMDGIEDMYLYEAMNYEKKKTSLIDTFSIRRRNAAFVLSLVLVIAVSVVLLRGFGGNIMSPEDGMDNVTDNDATWDVINFEDVLASADGRYYATEEEIDLIDGQVKFIYTDGDGYKTVSANTTAKDIENRFSLVEFGEGESYTGNVKVWISYGDGRVVSPYLKASAGNVGYNTLFDYDPEGVPSNAFSEFVSRML